ncbi:flavin monoamine oxidase family protein [Pseudomonas sp. JS3066]|jgi:monoamine oxidase|uniref:flavin monoamine oxidase family protein n=1 Tax=unclassified Pseudomonas TaxID=196821 RepID=UPI000EA947E2|nr:MULTISPECIES: flavin monoamine oxidase family protein [unclassified Pseudomonas]AYF89026.1 flavin monoamine oxidase family protein [Pseudomonas sp. DY-1]WVK93434.1 flavin monoamine oxidase family protein [Pseudomonas sp. JS3066]
MPAAWRALALIIVGGLSATALAKDKQPTAIVIGGGMAGLTSAYELQQKGWQVTVLEAKPSIGGRSGLAASEWVGSAKLQPSLYRYLDQFKLKAVPAPDYVRNPGYLVNGRYFSEADLLKEAPSTVEGLKRFDKSLDDLAASIDDPMKPLANHTLQTLDSISVARWLEKLSLPPTAKALVDQRIRSRYDEPSRLSLLYLAQQARVYRGLPDTEMRAARLPGGSQGLAQAMAKQIKTIKTNARVSAIVQEKDGVTVKVGGAGYQADYVVLAVPLPALGKISMTPSLSALQLRALKDINYGWRDQMLLQFKKPVWGKSRLSGEVYSDQGLGMLWVEPALKGGANLLINLSGDNARLMQAFGDRQMVDQVLIRFDKHFPGAREQFKGFELRRYGKDALAGGAYLAYGPGEISLYWRMWEQPLGRVVFAGEHTDALYPGTLEGALRSGQRAATQVADLKAGKAVGPVETVAEAKPVATPKAAATAEKKGFFSRLFN